MNYLILVLAALMAICFCGSREGFIDFGFSGYHKPASDFNFSDETQAVDMSQYTRDLTEVPVDTVRDIVVAVNDALKVKTGACMTPVQTIYINKYSNNKASVYDTRFMFYSPKHFFTTEILAKVVQNKDSPAYTVNTIRTQVPAASVGGPGPFGGEGEASSFEEYPQLLRDIAPSSSALQAVSKALKQNAPQQ